MPISRNSKVRDVWRHPLGRDMLCMLLLKTRRSPRWLLGARVGGMPLHALDKLAGPGFADLVAEMAQNEQAQLACPQTPSRAWWKDTVGYLVYLPSFMDSDHDGFGDIGGLIQRLPYLQKLGVGLLWLWQALDGTEFGGGAKDLRNISHRLGTSEDLCNLTKAAHARGMKIVLGVETAFTSDQHPAFQRALGGEKPDFYVLRKSSGGPPNNWAHPTAGSMWTYYPQADTWALNIFGRHRVDLNWENPAVRAAMADVLRHWASMGVDGFCLGTVNTLSKASFEDDRPVEASLTGLGGYSRVAFGPALHRYLRELRAETGCGAFLAGIMSGSGAEMQKVFTEPARGELDLALDLGWLQPRPRGPAGEDRLELSVIKRRYLERMEAFGEAGWTPLLLETPNTPRLVSRIGADPAYRAVAAKLILTMLLTLRGAPILYQGQELGLPNTRFASADELRDPAALRLYEEYSEKSDAQTALKRAAAFTADHARTPMPWTGEANGGFTGAQPWLRLPDGTAYLNASAQMADTGSVWRFCQKLIELREQSECLKYGSFNAVFANNKRLFCYFRIYERQKWYVEMNISEREVARGGHIAGSQRLVLSSYGGTAKALRPYEANIYICE